MKKTVFFLVLLIMPALVNAGVSGDAISELQDAFKNAVSGWFPALESAALTVLLFFATISLAYRAGFILLEGGGFEQVLAEVVRIILWAGFFWWVITNSQMLVETLIGGFLYLANQSNGASTSFSVADIFERGLVLSAQILDQVSLFNPTDILALILMALLVGMLYAMIGAHALFVIAEVYVVTTAGVILLGFGGNQWTSEYAMTYFRYAMGAGIKLFTLFLVIGIGENFIHDWAANLEYGEFPSIIALIGILLTIFYLVKLIPDAAQAMISGNSFGHATPTIGGMMAAAGGAMAGAAATAAGGSLAVAEAIKSAQGMEGNAFGNTLGNLAQSGAEVLGNRIMGDYNASSGGMMASMAQHMRQQRTGGSGLYGGTASGNDHIGGSATGGSFGAGDPATKEGTGPEEAENASHDLGGDGDVGGSEAGAGAAAWDTSKVGGKEHEFGADDGGSWSWDASGVAAAGGAGESDNPATRYRSPAVDLTRGGVPSFGGGGESSTAKNDNSGVAPSASSGAQSFTTNNDSGVMPSAIASGIAGGMVGSDNMASGNAASSMGSVSASANSGSDAESSTTNNSGSGAAPVSSAGFLRSESGAAGGSMNTVSAAQGVTASPDLAGTVVGSGAVQAATVGGLGEPSVSSSANGGYSVSSPSASDSGGQGSTTKNDNSGVAPSVGSSDGIGSSPLSGAVPPASGGSAAVTPRGRAGNKAKPLGGVMRDTDSLGDGDAGGGKPAA